jgi:hypothetical protein
MRPPSRPGRHRGRAHVETVQQWQHGSMAAVQNCSSAELQQCRIAAVQNCSSAELQQCRIAAVQQCSVATVQQCSMAALLQWRIAQLQQCSMAALQYCRIAAVQHGSMAAVQHGSIRAAREAEPTPTTPLVPAWASGCGPRACAPPQSVLPAVLQQCCIEVHKQYCSSAQAALQQCTSSTAARRGASCRASSRGRCSTSIRRIKRTLLCYAIFGARPQSAQNPARPAAPGGLAACRLLGAVWASRLPAGLGRGGAACLGMTRTGDSDGDSGR